MCVSGKEPTRGAAEGNNSKPLSSRTWISDVKQLSKNRSFVFSTLAMTTVKVATGVIGSYTLIFLHCARDIIQESARNPQTEVGSDYDSLIFGLISCISGILGVVVGAKIAKLYKKYKPCAVPIVYACGLHGSAIFLFFALFMGNISLVATYVFIFIGLMCLNLTYFVSADIRLDVASPASRSTAKAISMIVTDLLGKVGSSFFFGLIYECIKSYCPDTVLWKFQSLQCVLMACSSVVAIAGGCFFACACFIEKDHKTAETESEGTCRNMFIIHSYLLQN
ncbi:protein spinster homolog 1-like isoform X1 [Dendrobates tinctorius]|uniref:protein spinster homolog 1-like isoform X1 n=1 Tax=Dendrobates tinctorius TaxID=92724 RepID=UPI003CC95932